MNRILAISAGHYLYTSGKRCARSLDANETREWVLNDRIAVMLEEMLNEYDGISILRVDDRSGKVGISIQERCRISDKEKADFYLAIHHNAGAKLTNAGGVVVYYYPLERNRLQAIDLYNCVVSNNGLKGNRSKPISATDSLYEVTAPKADAILIENGFMDSLVDTPIILTEDYARKTAIGLCQFFVNLWTLQKKSTTEKVETPSSVAPVVDGSFRVKVLHNALNIRKSATPLSKLMGKITDHGTYTIVETKGDWGKLKSGAGWIHVGEKYCQRL